MIRGGDGSAGLAIRHPNGQLVKAYEWLPSSDYSEASSTGGYYGICLDNQFSRFASKLVNIYITVIKYDQWTKYAQEIEGLQLNMQNFTVSWILFHLCSRDSSIEAEKCLLPENILCWFHVCLFFFFFFLQSRQQLEQLNEISTACFNINRIHVAPKLVILLC